MSADSTNFSPPTPAPPPLFDRLAPVSVIHSAKGAFAAGLASIQPNGMQLKGVPSTLAHDEQVTVLLFGERIAGRVTQVSNDEVSIAFPPSPEVFDVIEAFEDFTTNDDSGGFQDCRSTEFADVTPSASGLYDLPAVDEQGCLHPQSPLDGLGMLLSLRANRPIMVRSEQTVSKVRLQFPDHAIETRTMPVSRNGYVLLPPHDLSTLDAAIAKLREAIDAFHPPQVSAPTSDQHTDDLPVLGTDGAVTFRSFAQFVFQVENNLSKAAIMAQGTAGEIGARQSLKLIIPESDPIEVSAAEIMFQDQGRVGFSVLQPQALRTAIQQAILKLGGPTLHGQPAPTPAPVLREPPMPKAPPATPIAHRVALSNTTPSPAALLDFARAPVRQRPPTSGWYVGVLDWALRLGKDLQVTITNDVESLSLWLHRGHVVGAVRRPTPGEDRLGNRLVAQRAITSDLLREAIKTSLKTKQPIGKVVIQSGKVAPAQVHRALRYQFLDRIGVPQEWTSGWIEVGEMSSMPANSELVAISRTTAVAHLLRKQLAQSRLPQLREATRRYLNQPVKVDLSLLLPSYRLNEREQEFFARCARAEGTVAEAISHARVRPIAAYRMLLLGTALGFVALTEPTLTDALSS